MGSSFYGHDFNLTRTPFFAILASSLINLSQYQLFTVLLLISPGPYGLKGQTKQTISKSLSFNFIQDICFQDSIRCICLGSGALTLTLNEKETGL